MLELFSDIRWNDKVLRICHTDLDGWMCEAIMPDTGRLYWYHYEPITVEQLFGCPDWKDRFEQVVLGDISLPKEVMKQILDAGLDVFWCDHHKTAIKTYTEAGFIEPGTLQGKKGNFRYSLSDNRPSASEVLWTTLRATPVPYVIKLVTAWDTWDLESSYRESAVALNNYFVDERFREFGMYMKMKANDPEKCMAESIRRQLILCLTSHINTERMVTRGSEIASYHYGKEFYDIRRGMFYSDFEGYRWLCYNASGNSQVLQDFFDPEKADGMLMFSRVGKVWKVSLYAGKDVRNDFSIIAKKYGGGGHAGACGFTVEKLPEPLV